MILALKNYLSDIRGYEVKSFPVEVLSQRFDVGFRTHEDVLAFVRVITENMILSEANTRIKAIKRALVELNSLANISEHKYLFCLALENNPMNMELVKQNSSLIELSMEVFLVNGDEVQEFNEIITQRGGEDDGFIL